MGGFKTYAVTFNIPREEFDELYNHCIAYNEESLGEEYGEHFDIVYLRDFGKEPTCIINLYEMFGPEKDIIQLLMKRLHLQRDSLVVAKFGE